MLRNGRTVLWGCGPVGLKARVLVALLSQRGREYDVSVLANLASAANRLTGRENLLQSSRSGCCVDVCPQVSLV